MAIKSTIKDSSESPLGFPKIMKNELGAIVLFSKHSRGTLLEGPTQHGYTSFGTYSSDWEMDLFRDFKGTLELTNCD